jgi:hypothetical protein
MARGMVGMRRWVLLAVVLASACGNGLAQPRPAASGPTTTTVDDAWCRGVRWTVFLEPSATPAQVDAVGAVLRATVDPSDLEYLDAEASYELFKREFKGNREMLNAVSVGDLPTSYRVRYSDLSDEVKREVERLPAVKQVGIVDPTQTC